MRNFSSDVSRSCGEPATFEARRRFLLRTSGGLGVAALSSLLTSERTMAASGGLPGIPHFPSRAKRVIFLFMSGAPSQMDLFDPKLRLQQMHGEEIPASVINGQRLTTMTSGQTSFPIAGSQFRFQRAGDAGLEISELLPKTAGIVDRLTVIRSMHTEPINHDPAITFLHTGNSITGRPSMGSWLSYGLGCESENLPAFIVLTSSGDYGGQPILSKYWHSGFLPGKHQGVQFRSQGDAVMSLTDPEGVGREARRQTIDAVNQMNQMRFQTLRDPEIQARISAYELAFQMQTSVPELMEINKEPRHILDMYGASSGVNSFANNCLLARRMIERGVRFVHLFDKDWDHHADLPQKLRKKTREVDQACAALVQDLAQRGLLEETLVIWGGEFGRTAYCQGTLTNQTYGRDHHPRCFTVWLAGGGMKPGVVLGKTDDFSYNIVEDPVHVHDLQATILHCLGIDHERLSYRYQGRDFRLTDVGGNVVQQVLA
ncbi:DUF1501 domain-containing protein [Planctomicrobium sp. SH661]|uniref:DUF1501 domain-containing protein n=1 Tax=Planctomicrobium sp. SH661 TaxID=3448124 RepID=UPI003F5AEFEC